MSLLSSEVHPLLTEEVLRALRLSCGVETARDLLAADVERLSVTLDAESVAEVRLACLSRFPEEVVCMMRDPAEVEGDTKTRIGTGVPGLNSLLCGGLMPGRVYELYGLPGTGKTQFCLSVSARCLIQDPARTVHRNVAYVDTKGDFHVDRVVEILRSHWRQFRGLRHRRILDGLRVRRVFDLSDLERDLERVLRLLDEGGGEKRDEEIVFWMRLRLLVLDSVASIVLPELGGGGTVRQTFLSVDRIVRQLRRLSARTGSCVLVVNHEKVRFTAEGDAEEEEEEGGGGGEDLHRPSLGKLFSGAADVRMRVSREAARAPLRTVAVEKCPPSDVSSLSEGKNCCQIRIGRGGWEEAE